MQAKVAALGLHQIQQLTQLPDAALIKRFNKETLCYLKQYLGTESDPQDYFQPPSNFCRSLNFLEVIHQSQGLLFPMKRLLHELQYFLRLQQKTTQCLYWTLDDIYQQQTLITIHMLGAFHNAEKSLDLTRLQLESVQLSGPIEKIKLTTAPLTHWAIPEASLLPQDNNIHESYHFINQIRARLGPNSCRWLSAEDNIVPELSNKTHVQRPSEKKTSHKKPLSTSSLVRPYWLFETPQWIGEHKETLYWYGRLKVVSQAERITHYWWKKNIFRDYFIAQDNKGIYYWIFYDELKRSWFVQGVFA